MIFFLIEELLLLILLYTYVFHLISLTTSEIISISFVVMFVIGIDTLADYVLFFC